MAAHVATLQPHSVPPPSANLPRGLFSPTKRSRLASSCSLRVSLSCTARLVHRHCCDVEMIEPFLPGVHATQPKLLTALGTKLNSSLSSTTTTSDVVQLARLVLLRVSRLFQDHCLPCCLRPASTAHRTLVPKRRPLQSNPSSIGDVPSQFPRVQISPSDLWIPPVQSSPKRVRKPPLLQLHVPTLKPQLTLQDLLEERVVDLLRNPPSIMPLLA